MEDVLRTSSSLTNVRADSSIFISAVCETELLLRRYTFLNPLRAAYRAPK